EAVARKVDEEEGGVRAVRSGGTYLVEVDLLGLARRRGYACDGGARPSEQAIDQGGLADVGLAGKRDLGKGSGLGPIRLRDCARKLDRLDQQGMLAPEEIPTRCTPAHGPAAPGPAVLRFLLPVLRMQHEQRRAPCGHGLLGNDDLADVLP